MRTPRGAVAVSLLLLCALPHWATGAPLEELVQRTYSPHTRAAAIAVLESLLTVEPRDRTARRALARALAWSGRLEIARIHYDSLLVAPAPWDSIPLAVERLHVRLWQGHTGEAERGLNAVLRRDSDQVEALIGLSQIQRWNGRPLKAHALARRAVGLAPDRPDASEALAWAQVDLQLGRAARGSMAEREASPALVERIRHVVGPVIHLMPVVSAESFDVMRGTLRAVVSGEPAPGLNARAGGGYTRLTRQETAVEVATFAAGGTLQGTWWAAHASGGVHATVDSLRPDALFRVSVRPSDGFQGALAVRLRTLLEVAEPLDVDEGAFYAAGAGGVLDLPAGSRLGIREARVQLQGRPTAWSYAYADLRGLLVSDDNAGYAAATGLGFDPLAPAGTRAPVQLMAHWDGYWAGYRESRPVYYSPRGFDSQGVGIRARWPQGDRFAVQGLGGGTFGIQGGSRGWFGGLGLEYRGRRVIGRMRVEIREDAYFEWRRLWVSLGVVP